jgi:hypothetical protein
VRQVILTGRWALAAEGVEYGDPTRHLETLGSAAAPARPGGDNRAVVAAALEALVARLRAAGKTVILVQSSPEIGRPVPQTLAKARLLGQAIDLEPTQAAYQARQAFVTALFERLRAKYGAVIVRPDQALCAAGRCAVEENGHPLYYDDHHLNRQGALKLTPLLAAALASEPAR